jgi:hypothetical protein
MEFAVRVNLKAVLAVVVVGALCVASFYAGKYNQAHKQVLQLGQYSASDVDMTANQTPVPPQFIADSIMVEAWCKTHPATYWAGHGGSGGCDAKGGAWVDQPSTGKNVPGSLPATFFNELGDGTPRWYQPRDANGKLSVLANGEPLLWDRCAVKDSRGNPEINPICPVGTIDSLR